MAENSSLNILEYKGYYTKIHFSAEESVSAKDIVQEFHK